MKQTFLKHLVGKDHLESQWSEKVSVVAFSDCYRLIICYKSRSSSFGTSSQNVETSVRCHHQPGAGLARRHQVSTFPSCRVCNFYHWQNLLNLFHINQWMLNSRPSCSAHHTSPHTEVGGSQLPASPASLHAIRIGDADSFCVNCSFLDQKRALNGQIVVYIFTAKHHV